MVAPVTLSALPISIHALREEGDLLHVGSAQAFNISIHALREEGDVPSGICVPGVPVFLSTPSARRATASVAPILLAMAYFYPRPPRGGRPVVRAGDAATVPISIHALREEGDQSNSNLREHSIQFLSTPSARRATEAEFKKWQSSVYFYPRPPRGGRRAASRIFFEQFLFLSTPSARRATYALTRGYGKNKFLSTPSARRATHCHQYGF